MHKLAGLSLVVALAAVAVVIWAKAPSFTRPAQAVPAAGLSPSELQRQIDVNSLPEQVIDNPI